MSSRYATIEPNRSGVDFVHLIVGFEPQTYVGSGSSWGVLGAACALAANASEAAMTPARTPRRRIMGRVSFHGEWAVRRSVPGGAVRVSTG